MVHVILCFLFFITLTPDLFGYIDPGTGSYLLQICIAGGMAALYVVKTQWRSVKAFFANRFSRKK